MEDAKTSSEEALPDLIVSGSFVSSASWRGPRDGYVYKTGDLGLGYYIDSSVQEAVYQWRQDEGSVTILVPVKGAVEGSMTHSFTSNSMVANFEGEDGTRFELDLHFSGTIDSTGCKGDVSEENIVFLLRKATSGYWKELLSCEKGEEKNFSSPSPTDDGMTTFVDGEGLVDDISLKNSFIHELE